VEQSERKKLIWLAALIAVLAAIWGYRTLFQDGSLKEVQTPVNARRGAPGPPARPVVVNMGLLEGEKPRLEIGRNIFDPTYRERKVLPPDLEAEARAKAKAKAEAEAARPNPLAAVSVGPPKDTDNDGVPDNVDKCPGTPPGAIVDSSGCQPGELTAKLAKEEMGKIQFVGFLKRSGRTDVFLTYKNSYFVVTKGGDIMNGLYLKDIGGNYLLFADRATGAELLVNVDFTGEKDKGKDKGKDNKPGGR